MASDKKEYQAVLNALLDHSTLTSLINKLNKIWVTTEDPSLKKHLEPVIVLLKNALLDLRKRSQVVSLGLSQPQYKPIVDYCRQCLDSIKPEWQIIAEQHGWGPKQ